MLEVESMCVDVSRVGRILDDVSVWAGQGVTLVTGRVSSQGTGIGRWCADGAWSDCLGDGSTR